VPKVNAGVGFTCVELLNKALLLFDVPSPPFVLFEGAAEKLNRLFAGFTGLGLKMLPDVPDWVCPKTLLLPPFPPCVSIDPKALLDWLVKKEFEGCANCGTESPTERSNCLLRLLASSPVVSARSSSGTLGEGEAPLPKLGNAGAVTGGNEIFDPKEEVKLKSVGPCNPPPKSPPPPF